MLPSASVLLLFCLGPQYIARVFMEKQQVHPEVVHFPDLNNHILRTNSGIAIVNPLKKPVERSGLKDTNLHPDVKLCRSGLFLLVHEGKVVAKVIPVPQGKEKTYLPGWKE